MSGCFSPKVSLFLALLALRLGLGILGPQQSRMPVKGWWVHHFTIPTRKELLCAGKKNNMGFRWTSVMCRTLPSGFNINDKSSHAYFAPTRERVTKIQNPVAFSWLSFFTPLAASWQDSSKKRLRNCESSKRGNITTTSWPTQPQALFLRFSSLSLCLSSFDLSLVFKPSWWGSNVGQSPTNQTPITSSLKGKVTNKKT